jgi:muramoyltetrapeptide carboxypeptidase
MRRGKVSVDGGFVGITAASSVVEPALLARGLKRFAAWGIPVLVDDNVYHAKRYLAGTDSVRLTSLMRMLRDPLVGVLWCARGGYGATRLLPLLDLFGAGRLLRRRAPLLLGFSDVTALHFYFWKYGLPSVHAPMPGTGGWQRMKPGTVSALREILAGEMPLAGKSRSLRWRTRYLRGSRGSATGTVVGGNLSLLVSLIGTPWQPDLRGCLLFLEDCGERPYRVDRMLTQLENAGMLRGLRGVLLGDFEADVVYAEAAEKRYWTEIFQEKFLKLKIPVLVNLPVGHGKENEPLPLGVRARITSRGRLEYLEQPVH